MFTLHFDNGQGVVAKQPLHYLFKITKRPIIPFPEEIIRELSLGNGKKHYEHTGEYQERIIKVECNLVAKSKRLWIDHMAQLQKYFVGSGTLTFSDDPQHYWKVKKVVMNISSRERGRESEFTLEFTCDPYRYIYSEPLNYEFSITPGSEWVGVTQDMPFINPYDKCFPKYTIVSDRNILLHFENANDEWKYFEINYYGSSGLDTTVADNRYSEIVINTESLSAYAYITASIYTLRGYFNALGESSGDIKMLTANPGQCLLKIGGKKIFEEDTNAPANVRIKIDRNYREL